jgi:hypothetical protein
LTYKKYTENGSYTRDCTNEGCTACDKSEAMPAIFRNNGYSVSVTGSMMQSFAVDKDTFGEYTRVNGNIMTFGLVAAVKSEVINTADGKLFSAVGVKKHEKVATVDFTSLNYDVMEMVVVGLDKCPEVEVYCCLYFTVNDDIYYINDGVESTTTEATSYQAEFPEVALAAAKDEE